jgi:hypothetical protein
VSRSCKRFVIFVAYRGELTDNRVSREVACVYSGAVTSRLKACNWIPCFAVVLVVATTSCGPAQLKPAKRPSGVPANAVWAGGADRGAYVRCSLDEQREVDKCIVWKDYNGETDGLKDYRLEKEHRAASVDELKFTGR